MTRDVERVERIRQGLRGAGLDALVCSLPANVLLLSGYWPVVGTSLAVATADGRVAVLAPADEKDLTAHGWADEVRTFEPGSLTAMTDAQEAVRQALAEVLRGLGLGQGRVGHESGPAFEPASYASLHLYGAALPQLLSAALPAATLTPADDLLARLKAVKTAGEAERIRVACRIAERAFAEGAARLRPGLTETEAAALFRTPLSTAGVGWPGVDRADGFTFCMSGPDSARAFGAYARSRSRQLQDGDLVLVHCNSYADGRWTDITRTYSLGAPDRNRRAWYDAVLAARAAALQAIRPGARAAEVDRAARQVLQERGLGEAFKHGTGHGVGFGAISHTTPPRLHPASDDTLAAGMVFNVEPAVYFEGQGGIRHCDMVLVTATGVEVLTPFQASVDDLVRPPR